MSFKIKNEIKKIDNNIQNIKESQTLDKKHKEIIKNFENDKSKLEIYDDQIEEIDNKILQMDKYRADLCVIIQNKLAEISEMISYEAVPKDIPFIYRILFEC